jgi:hypothetical protein
MVSHLSQRLGRHRMLPRRAPRPDGSSHPLHQAFPPAFQPERANVPNAMAQLPTHRPASWALGYSSSLHGRGQALSARTEVLRVQPPRAEISPFDLLVRRCCYVVPPTQLRLVTCDDADNMCSRAAVPTTLANQLAIVQRYDRNRFGWPCLVLCL